MATKMNTWLTKGSLAVLNKLIASEDREVTWEKGAGYWIGYGRVPKKDVEHLLQLCLLRQVHSDNHGGYIVYEASSEVEQVLANDSYTPAIITAQRTGQPQFIERPTKDLGSRFK